MILRVVLVKFHLIWVLFFFLLWLAYIRAFRFITGGRFLFWRLSFYNLCFFCITLFSYSSFSLSSRLFRFRLSFFSGSGLLLGLWRLNPRCCFQLW
jgi:hypothetical protein